MQFVLPVSPYPSRALDTVQSTLTWLLSSRPLRRTHSTLLSFCLFFDCRRVPHALCPMQNLSAGKTVRMKSLGCGIVRLFLTTKNVKSPPTSTDFTLCAPVRDFLSRDT